jgi:carbonic anhydrase/acetyltransferase-like protein (isoleucine patch superfamily)
MHTNVPEAPQVPIYALGDALPVIDPSAFISPDAVVIGRVTIGPETSVWPCAVLRGDYGAITVGAQTSIQDGAVLHATADLDTTIGDRCVIGHLAHLEGCLVGDDCLIGSGAVVLHRVVVENGALVGAGAVVPNGTVVPSRAMALGVPARIREDAVAAGAFAENVASYVRNGHRFGAELRRIG